LTTDRIHVETQPEVSLHWRSAAEGVIGMTETCVTAIMAEMHMTGLEVDAKKESTLNRSGATRRTMIIMVRSTTNLTDNAPPKEGVMQED
jgi:hypothetical protein